MILQPWHCGLTCLRGVNPVYKNIISNKSCMLPNREHNHLSTSTHAIGLRACTCHEIMLYRCITTSRGSHGAFVSHGATVHVSRTSKTAARYCSHSLFTGNSNCCNELKRLVFSGYVFVCSTAKQKRSKAGYAAISKQVRGLLTVFEANLDEAGLPQTHRRWMQFCLINTYILLRACYEYVKDFAALFQVIVFLNVIPPITSYVASFVFQI